MVVGSKVFGGRGRPLVAVDKEVMTAIFDAGIKYDFEWRDLAVEVHGESAISTAFLDGTITNADSSQVQGPWRTSTAWVKDGGKWKIVHYHVSQLLPDVEGAEALIARYHKAVEERDAVATLACLGDTYVQAGRTLQGFPGDPSRWQGAVLDADAIAHAWTTSATRTPPTRIRSSSSTRLWMKNPGWWSPRDRFVAPRGSSRESGKVSPMSGGW